MKFSEFSQEKKQSIFMGHKWGGDGTQPFSQRYYFNEQSKYIGSVL
jgi:hypothetical protein